MVCNVRNNTAQNIPFPIVKRNKFANRLRNRNPCFCRFFMANISRSDYLMCRVIQCINTGNGHRIALFYAITREIGQTIHICSTCIVIYIKVTILRVGDVGHHTG